ncbi:conserved hypothetical protein of the DUF493 family [Candidatus Kinetoplastibacterium desouzaii TCC079E]|uniref:Uncharacterized protein n=1 Tax=Candidatus Kinetoplastidibacterium desouzai TCC079E TaxID=1208919 RepID=M1LT26_9PROT|nr:DUF493 domain-containing protein [Candidatus Kinetoplastibacterium desouzaii]AGF47236.1 conserved hypothetical protein of the DUF493 family [Candidatus Kinetoplastibacterium desouzaii TCC079E]
MNHDATQEISHYPGTFPIKIIGVNNDNFNKEIINLLTELGLVFEKEIETSFSKSNRYISLTVSIYVLSRDHFNYIYESLGRHPMVRFII